LKPSQDPKPPSQAPTTEPEIWIHGVSKDFPVASPTAILREGLALGPPGERFQALTDLEIAVEPGKLLGLLGHNGAGKSTLLRVTAKVYEATAGVVQLGGDTTAVFELGLGGSPGLTGRDFCFWHFCLMGIPEEDRTALVKDVEDFAELGAYFDQQIRTYSSGMRARLFFGAATAVPAPVILMDEVMCVGDEHFRGKSFRRLQRLVASGAAGILASHDWQTSLRLCDEIGILEHGKLCFRGTPREAVCQYIQEGLRFSRRAEFVDREQLLALPIEFVTGEPLHQTFTIKIHEPTPVEFGYSIEAPELGTALMLSIEHPIGSTPGIYQVSLEFEEFPVALEECSLSLFLSAPLSPDGSGEREIHDSISWTNGESLRLVRKGSSPYSPPPLLAPPMSWEFLPGETS
jgi:lipopolysaccharide transport system ATP-binding protein